ncbi:mitofusin [Malassezia vespertilionis]|uniref:Fzo1p n=1 Tax=Malassezia vespertilionis TaxID=2020962 RepID=A0A2N1J9D7_9BASI|nr:mitofusin [Malassezia vespertilionis]PKI83163.1 Fzo1p [Malassezia vespertilionis]WFD07661.1 mitofusin [Malassezia vespertilionis]
MLAAKVPKEYMTDKMGQVTGGTILAPPDASLDLQQTSFLQSRDRLVGAIDDTDTILRGLREFNRDQWVLRYNEEVQSDQAKPLSVLRLELKLGATVNANVLMDSMEKSSVGKLLDERMARCTSHLQKLRIRISDTQSKVLVTGDLNAGKSTFVNALMRREMMPVDQQPCTMLFCEIHDAAHENKGAEEVHIVRDLAKYDVADDATFERRTLSALPRIFEEEEDGGAEIHPVLKCYCTGAEASRMSLLHNQAVDIALIDAPGLNRDCVHTTALFTREEEIDVVIFVVDAENHFTLSACEFLQNASNEKAYVFVVVNKYAEIQNKAKCRQRVLEQIRTLSPRTYEEADQLVHFVDARSMCEASGASDEHAQFDNLEMSLHDFVLRRRAKSKLMPAQTYLQRLLNDILFLSQLNMQAAKDDIDAAHAQLTASRPALAMCETNAHKVQRVVENVEDRVVARTMEATECTLAAALEKIGRGECADATVLLPPYPGLFEVWSYARNVRLALLTSLGAVVKQCEEAARTTTTAAIHEIDAVGAAHLPESDEPERVFVPEAMFAHKNASTMLAGIGVSVDVVAVNISDLFDVTHRFAYITGSSATKPADETLLLPSISLGLGALTLAGTRSLGIKSAIEAFVRVTDILGSRTARRWAPPIVLLASVGALAWVVLDLPNAVPRNVGRSLKRDLTSGRCVRASGNSKAMLRNSSDVFSTMHGTRVTRETRKVLRLASWDLQERFRIAILKCRTCVEQAEEQERCASIALAWFENTVDRSAAVSETVASAIDVVK